MSEQHRVNGHAMGEHFRVEIPDDPNVHTAITTPFVGRIHVSHARLGEDQRQWTEVTEPVDCPGCIHRLDELIASWEKDAAKKLALSNPQLETAAAYQAVADALRAIPRA